MSEESFEVPETFQIDWQLYKVYTNFNFFPKLPDSFSEGSETFENIHKLLVAFFTFPCKKKLIYKNFPSSNAIGKNV